MFRDAWSQRGSQVREQRRQLKAEQDKLQQQIDQLLDKVVLANNKAVVGAYEKRIESCKTNSW